VRESPRRRRRIDRRECNALGAFAALARNARAGACARFPRGTHSAKMDRVTTPSCSIPITSNCSACSVETEHNAPARAFLAKRGEGTSALHSRRSIRRPAPRRFRARGYEPLGPTDFERPVTLPDGSLRRPNSGSSNGPYPKRRVGCAFSPVSTRRGKPCGFRS